MYSRNRTPGWRADVKWLAGIVLVIAATLAAAFFSLAVLSRPAAGSRVLAGILRPVLLGEDGSRIAATSESEFTPGGPLQLLPGLEISLDPTELQDFDAEQAQNRIAGVMTSLLREGGQDGVLGLASDSQLLEQLRGALAGPVRQLVSAQLGAALLGSGLADGSRMADWRTQAANNPGAPVQPLVGVFVTAPVSVVSELSAAGIGQLAIDGLAEEFLAGGEGAARELLANQNLLARYDEAVGGPLASGLHGLFRALLLGFSDEIAGRLEAAQQQLSASTDDGDFSAGLHGGLLSQGELDGLSVAEANELLLNRLGERVHEEGPAVLDNLLADQGQLAAARQAAPLLQWFTGAASNSYLRWGWLASIVALVMALTLVAASSGRGRLTNPGVALLVAGLPGLLLTDRFGRWLQDLAAQAGRFRGQGFVADTWEGMRSLFLAVPQELIAAARLPWLSVAAAGALLLLLVVLLWLGGMAGPRRRRF